MMVWMLGDGMYDGDPLIADSSLRPREGNLIIVRAGTEQLIKRVMRRGGALYLVDGAGPSGMIELKSASDV
jgi:SOS-response transcriptional repressor LexA